MRSLPPPGSTGPNARPSATTSLLELAMVNFYNLVATQKIVLEFSRRQNEFAMGVAKEWVGRSSPAGRCLKDWSAV